MKAIVAKCSIENIIFRNAKSDEALKVCKFGEQELIRTFGHLYENKKDLSQYLKEAYTENAYLTWINNKSYFVYGAYANQCTTLEQVDSSEKCLDQELLGYILAGPCTLPIKSNLTVTNSGEVSKDCLQPGEIKRLYVHPSAFGSGIANTLMTAALDWLRSEPSQESRDVYLGVYSENYRAQKFYSKYNFQKVGEYSFMVGSQADREFILKQDIK